MSIRNLALLALLATLLAACGGAPVGSMRPLSSNDIGQSSFTLDAPPPPTPQERIAYSLREYLQDEFDKQPEYRLRITEVVPVKRSGLDNVYDTVVKVRTGAGTEVPVMYEVTSDPETDNMVWKADIDTLAQLDLIAERDASSPSGRWGVAEPTPSESAPADAEGDCTPSLLTGELICGIGDGSPPPPAP
ncbi:hypothetical protein MPNTM1_03339 [Mycolicibacterium parafortuitum]|uniref:hypothetical protein n=1 Tax=Mycolicibacterium parafortuitum TaxID=39692 RepID=UPI0032C44CD4